MTCSSHNWSWDRYVTSIGVIARAVTEYCEEAEHRDAGSC